MMTYLVLLLALVASSAQTSMPGVAIEVRSSSSNTVTANVVFDGRSEARIPLGLVAIPEGASIQCRATLSTGEALAVETGEPGMIRELRVIPVALRCSAEPSSSPSTALVTIEVTSVEAGRPVFDGYLPLSFVELVRPYVLNWDQVVLRGRSPGLRYLIVSTNELAGSLAGLFDWKERKGLAPQLATLSQTGTTDYDIRTYIRNIYNTTGTLEYVLLVGDAPALPTHEYYNPIGGGYLKSDRYYATFVGGDDLPDVFIGRLPAASTSDLGVMIDKALTYEHGTGDGPWMERGVVASGNEHPSHPATKRTVQNWLLSFGYDEVDTVFAPTGTGVQLLQELNDGRSVLNYRGGVADREQWSEIGWSQDYCYYMQNGLKRPLVTSVICLTGDFTYTGGVYGECLGESFLRAPGGAVAFFGASQITHTYANNTLDLGIYDGLTHLGLTRVGPICDAGLFYLFNNYPPSDTVTVELRQYNLLGDPELPLWTHEPNTMSVDHPASVPTGTSPVTVSTGVGGALVCLRGAGVYEATYADGSGNAYFQITPTGQGTIDVTATIPGFVPYQGQMTVAAAYAIGGTVRTQAGSPLAGATVNLTGSSTGQITTGADGTYAFVDLAAGGTYTVTPSYSDIAGNWTFSPQNRTFNNLQADQWGQDFTGSIPRYTISGTVRTYLGAPVSGVTVTLSGFQQGQTTTNAQGAYQFTGLLGAETYTVTPSYSPAEGSWTFSPESRTIELLNSNHWSEDFTGTPPLYGISGKVRNEVGTPLQGVRLVLSGDASDTTFSAADGSYSFTALVGGGSYTVVPHYAPPEGVWTFTPPDYQFNPLNGSQVNRDFVAMRPRYAISGFVAARNGGVGLAEVTIRLSGGVTDSVLTGSDGSYLLSNIPGGLSYSITARKAYNDSVWWGFDPASIAITSLVGNLEGQSFMAQLPVLISVEDGLGQPGSTGNAVDVGLDNETYNDVSLDSLAFTVVYTSAFGAHIPAEGGVEAAGRAEGFTVEYEVNEAQAASCSLFVMMKGSTPLVPGNDVICRLMFSLAEEADTTRATSLRFAAAAAWDTVGISIPVDRHDTGRFGSGLGAPPAAGPGHLVLHPPVPNPAGGEVSISFELPRSSRSAVVVRDLTGRVVAKLDQGTLSSGYHTVVWSGRSTTGSPLPNGTYHCQLVACGQTAGSLIVLLR